MSDDSILIDIALSFTIPGSLSLTSPQVSKVRKTLSQFISKRININQCSNVLASLGASTDFLPRLKAICDISPIPIPPRGHNDEFGKKKANPWSEEEDNRLIAAINRFGISDWSHVSEFVGNGRTRAQCGQRWLRCLNPKNKKDAWTLEEDKKLEELITSIGEQSWAKIAQKMGNRCDVQCRYRWVQLLRKNKQCVNHTIKIIKPKASSKVPNAATNPLPVRTPERIPCKPIIQAIDNPCIQFTSIIGTEAWGDFGEPFQMDF